MNQYKNILIALVTILLVAVVIYFIGKRAGKKQSPETVDLPPDTQPGNITTFNPGVYTDAIHQDIYEFWGLKNFDAYKDLLALSNSQLVSVYNDWNQRYYSEDQETLYKAIEAEYPIGIEWSSLRSTVLKRLASLGLN